MDAEKEKRTEQTAAKPIPVKIKEKGNIFATETMDINSSGAYCRTVHPIPLLSKVAVTLVVPALIKGKKIDKTIDCKGTIVRTHPVIIDGKTVGYDVAIFFNELKKEDKILISEHIKQSSNKEQE